MPIFISRSNQIDPDHKFLISDLVAITGELFDQDLILKGSAQMYPVLNKDYIFLHGVMNYIHFCYM